MYGVWRCMVYGHTCHTAGVWCMAIHTAWGYVWLMYGGVWVYILLYGPHTAAKAIQQIYTHTADPGPFQHHVPGQTMCHGFERGECELVEALGALQAVGKAMCQSNSVVPLPRTPSTSPPRHPYTEPYTHTASRIIAHPHSSHQWLLVECGGARNCVPRTIESTRGSCGICQKRSFFPGNRTPKI